ncbi:MAG: CsgG/HfaB family protein [Nanoarchaeota archaeon]
MKTYQKVVATLGLLGTMALSNPAYAEKAISLASQSSTISSESQETPSVAILNFKYNTKNKPNVEEMLATNLAQFDCIALHERAGLQSILKEMKLGMTGIIDEKTAAKVGKVAGVEKVILGSYNLAGDRARIDIRYIDVKTGKVEFGKCRIGDASDLSLIDRLADDLRAELCGEPPIATEVEKGNPFIAAVEGSTLISVRHTVGDDNYSFHWNGKEVTLTPIEKCPQFVKRRPPVPVKIYPDKLGSSDEEGEIKAEDLDLFSVSCYAPGFFTIGGKNYVELNKCSSLASTIVEDGVPDIIPRAEAPPGGWEVEPIKTKGKVGKIEESDDDYKSPPKKPADL